MAIGFSEATLRLLDGKNYAVLATVNADGSPQTSVVWVGRDGSNLLFSTIEGRVKHRNMVRDPRVSVTVIDSADPENYVELRGTVSMTPDVGRRIDTLRRHPSMLISPCSQMNAPAGPQVLSPNG